MESDIPRLNTEYLVFWFARIALALIFIWFGLLKVLGFSPVFGVIEAAFPIIAQSNVLYGVLGFSELVLGVGILIPRLTSIIGALIVGHLVIATVAVLRSPQAFPVGFPILSVVGEFVVKNIALIGLVLTLIWQRNIRSASRQ